MHALLTLWQLSLGAAASHESPPAKACPAAADVEAVLRRRGDDEAVEALRRSDVTVQGHILRVILRDDAGTVVGVRELEAPTDCAERASLAAVLLSAWARTWSNTTLVPLPTPASTKPRARQIEIGVAAGGTDDGDARAVGVALLGGVQLREGWGVALALDTAGGRDADVGPGVGRYAVSRLGAGPCFRRGDGAWFDVALLPQLTRLAVEGRGLMSSRPSVLWGAAVTTRLRAGLRWGDWAPFAGLGGTRNLVRETLTLDDIGAAGDSRTLSSWDVEVEIGLSWLWRSSE